jgi:hypothetical protein
MGDGAKSQNGTIACVLLASGYERPMAGVGHGAHWHDIEQTWKRILKKVGFVNAESGLAQKRVLDLQTIYCHTMLHILCQ